MEALKKLIAKADVIPQPYSTILVVVVFVGFATYILFFSNNAQEIGFAKGVIFGCVGSLLLKWSLESSDKANWSKIKKLLGFRNG